MPRRTSPAARPDRPVPAALMSFALLAAGPAGSPTDSSAPTAVAAVKFAPFALEDQFGRVHAVKGSAGEVRVILYGDRAAADACRKLGAELHVLFHPAAAGKDVEEAADAPVRAVPGSPAGSARPPVRVTAAACAAGTVPRPIRAAVAWELRRAAPHTPVWLDWGGKLHAAFGVTPGVPNAVVIPPTGPAYKIRVADEGAAGRVESTVEALRRGLLRR